MLVTMLERREGSAARVAEIILENRGHFMRDGKTRRVALGVVSKRGIRIIEVLPGTKEGFVETRTTLRDFVRAFPQQCRQEILSLI